MAEKSIVARVFCLEGYGMVFRVEYSGSGHRNDGKEVSDYKDCDGFMQSKEKGG